MWPWLVSSFILTWGRGRGSTSRAKLGPTWRQGGETFRTPYTLMDISCWPRLCVEVGGFGLIEGGLLEKGAAASHS